MSTIRAAIYARVSTKPQAGEDKISIPDQLRECKASIQKEGWQCMGEFIDPGVSANTIERPGLRKLFEALEAFDVVVAWDFDRFYRERRSVAGYILDTLDEHKKQITSLKQPIPIYDPVQYDPRENDTPYMLREMAGFTSGIDNRRRYRTLRKGIQERFRQGYMMKPPPYGYRLAYAVVDGKIVKLPREVVPTEAHVVRRIFREYLTGKSYFAIACGLNADRIPSRKKPYWSANVVRSVLRNPTYCGKVHHQTVGNGKKKVLPEDEWIVVQGKHEAIITAEDWQEARAIRKRKQKTRRASGSPLLLSGILRCGYCNYGMCKDGSWGGGYYICGQYKQTRRCRRNGYRRTALERDVLADVFQMLRSEDIFDKVRGQQQDELVVELTSEVKRIEKLLAELPQRKSRLFDLYETGHITREAFIERNEDHLRNEHAHLQLLQEKRARLATTQSAAIDRQMFLATLDSLEQDWEHCDPVARKQKLAALIDRIVIKDGTFRLYFRLALSEVDVASVESTHTP